MAVGIHLGLNLCVAHQYRCGAQVDAVFTQLGQAAGVEMQPDATRSLVVP